jgi:hypothetical protein
VAAALYLLAYLREWGLPAAFFGGEALFQDAQEEQAQQDKHGMAGFRAF